MSFFDSVTQLPEDPILSLPIAFNADQRPNKVNLGIGTYKDENGKSLILSCVKKAEAGLISRELSKEYLPIEGSPSFIKASSELIFSKKILAERQGGFFGAQALGGTGALRLGGEFLVQETSKSIFVSTPSWPNHKVVFSRAGMKVHHYRYYDENNFRIDFHGMCHDIKNMPPGSTILLHASCHNPTGLDLSMEEWHEISQLIKKQRVIPFFDFAYQGFKDNVEDDANAIRYFASQGHEMLVANSFSKNFGLYGERVGSLCIFTHHQEAAHKAGSQVKQIIRGNFSNPPRHGAQIITDILQSESLHKEWLQELAGMRDRIKGMRKSLLSGFEREIKDKDWSFVGRQFGFFSFCGLSLNQTQRMLQEYAIYMPTNGRINIAGLNEHNIEYVINALADVLKS